MSGSGCSIGNCNFWHNEPIMSVEDGSVTANKAATPDVVPLTSLQAKEKYRMRDSGVVHKYMEQEQKLE